MDTENKNVSNDAKEEMIKTNYEATEENSSLETENVDPEGSGAPAENQVSTNTEEPSNLNKIFCAKCGSELQEGQIFCPKCGQKVGEKLETQKNVGKNKNLIKVIAGGIAVAIAIIAVVISIRGPQAKDITLNKRSLTLKVGEFADLSYTITPESTKNKNVKWSSSNDSIATVNDGNISAKNEGDCIITVTTNNGKTDTVELTVTAAGPDFASIYNQYCDSSYASVASDGSYLSIDTNPNDSSYNSYEEDAILAIYSVNEALGLPDSVITQMGQTRSIDGRQSYSNSDVEVSWTYHPDNGLEILYMAVQ